MNNTINDPNFQIPRRKSTLKSVKTIKTKIPIEFQSFISINGDIQFENEMRRRNSIKSTVKRKNSNESFVSCDEDSIGDQDIDDLLYSQAKIIQNSKKLQQNEIVLQTSDLEESKFSTNNQLKKGVRKASDNLSQSSSGLTLSDGALLRQFPTDVEGTGGGGVHLNKSSSQEDNDNLELTSFNDYSHNNTSNNQTAQEHLSSISMQKRAYKDSFQTINDQSQDSKSEASQFEFDSKNFYSLQRSHFSEHNDGAMVPSYPNFNYNDPNNQPHELFAQRLKTSFPNKIMNRVSSIKNQQQMLVIRDTFYNNQSFTLNFIAILHSQLKSHKKKDSENALLVTKIIFFFSIILRFYLYGYMIFFCISYDNYLYVFIPLITLARFLYVLSILQVLFLYDYHNYSLRKITKIFLEALSQQQYQEFDNFINMPQSELSRLQIEFQIINQVLFAVTPPEFCMWNFQGDRRSQVNAYLISNMILQGIESIVFWPVLAGLIIKQTLISRETEFDEETDINIVTLFVLLGGTLGLFIVSIIYIIDYFHSQQQISNQTIAYLDSKIQS